jgi:diguanylate cyclase (GGDEF)-like protein
MTSVRTRILLFFTLFAIASLAAVAMSSRSTKTIGAAANDVVHRHLPMVHAVGEMEIALQREDNCVYRYLVNKQQMTLDEFEKDRLDYSRWFLEAQTYAEPSIEADMLSQIDELYVQYDNQARKVLLTDRHDPAAATRMLRASDEFLRQIEALIDQIKGIRQGMTIVRQEQITQTLYYHGRVAIYFLVTICLFFVLLGAYLWKFLVQPLSLLLDGIRNFTRGKTDIQIPRIGKDELGELQEAFNEMSRELDVERKRLRSESQSDSLTGLFNMRYFRMQLVEEFSRSQRYSRPLTLLMIDVDNFKAYNDRNGHPAGDIVLKEVSRILIRNVRGTDIVARYGGEEFVVLLPETPLDAGMSVAEKIRKAVEEHYFPFAGSKTGERLTVSVGVASYPDVRITSDQDLVEASDKALYAAKRAGRNRVCASSPQGQVVSAPASPKAPHN